MGVGLVQTSIVVGAALQAKPIAKVGCQVTLAFDTGFGAEPIQDSYQSGLSCRFAELVVDLVRFGQLIIFYLVSDILT